MNSSNEAKAEASRINCVARIICRHLELVPQKASVARHCRLVRIVSMRNNLFGVSASNSHANLRPRVRPRERMRFWTWYFSSQRNPRARAPTNSRSIPRLRMSVNGFPWNMECCQPWEIWRRVSSSQCQCRGICSCSRSRFHYRRLCLLPWALPPPGGWRQPGEVDLKERIVLPMSKYKERSAGLEYESGRKVRDLDSWVS